MTGSATIEEAAAIAAALDRFARETAPPPAGGGGAEAPDPWTRAAMLEGVSRDVDHADAANHWINT